MGSYFLSMLTFLRYQEYSTIRSRIFIFIKKIVFFRCFGSWLFLFSSQCPIRRLLWLLKHERNQKYAQESGCSVIVSSYFHSIDRLQCIHVWWTNSFSISINCSKAILFDQHHGKHEWFVCFDPSVENCRKKKKESDHYENNSRIASLSSISQNWKRFWWESLWYREISLIEGVIGFLFYSSIFKPNFSSNFNCLRFLLYLNDSSSD